MKTINRSLLVVGLVALLLMYFSGCEPQRPNLSERQVDELLSMPAEATAASRELVEHDAKSREALMSLHADVQAELSEIGRRQEQLEQDRKALATQRQVEPMIANAIGSLGLLAACLLPLAVVALLLWPRHSDPKPDAVCEFLANEVVNSREAARLEDRRKPVR